MLDNFLYGDHAILSIHNPFEVDTHSDISSMVVELSRLFIHIGVSKHYNLHVYLYTFYAI